MEDHGIVSTREKLESVIGNYHDFLGDEAGNLCRQHGIDPAKKLQVDLASIAEKGRLLKIGVVGRTNSGKSSLLNALLFEGQSILPKAATSMTAALTTLSYGEKLAAEVEFFTDADFKDIEAKYKEYKQERERLYRTYLDEIKRVKRPAARSSTASRTPEERAGSKADREMREKTEISAAHDQYTKMKKAGWSNRNSGKETLVFADLADLRGQLDEYVGADGRYMPFTKGVNIQLPQENLKDIEIVDTPGINDPVQSREERTREHLSQCDVVLIVSPAGQFMTKEDLNLMDRITGKEGVRELRVLAAQADTQLYGNLRTENDGQFDRVLDRLAEILGSQLEKIIAALKKSNPEVTNIYDSLLAGKGSIIVSSGMCESLRQRFSSQDEWDEDMQHAWGNLLDMYPDYFSVEDANLSDINLVKLSNIAAVRDVVEEVRVEKDRIIEERTRDYVQAKCQSLRALKGDLLAFADDRKAEIEGKDIEDFKAQRRELEKSLGNAAEDIRLHYRESVEDIKMDLNRKLKGELEKERQTLSGNIDQETQTKTGKKRGLFAWCSRFFGGGYETYTTIRTNAYSQGLLAFSRKMADSFAQSATQKRKEWRDNLIRKMTEILRSNFDDDQLEPSTIRRVVRRAVDSVSIPDFKYDPKMPKSLLPQGVLERQKAEAFIEEAGEYLYSLCDGLSASIDTHLKELTKIMERVRLDKELLEQFREELAALEKSIENKEVVLKRISSLRDELERIEINREFGR